MSWRDELRRASWRGIEFDVLAADGRFGRRTVLHEYPFRDAVWVEDLGLGARRLHLVGYLVGDDVADQQDAMIEAAETEGGGELVHPTLGLRQVSLVEFGTAARHDLGRVIELSFTFVESGERIFPAAGISTSDLLQSAATGLGGAAETDFLSGLQAAARGGTDAVRQAQRTLQGWTSTASRLAGGASNAINAVGALVPGGSGNRFSRYLAGSRSPLAFLGTGSNTVSGALGRVSRAQAAARQGARDLQSLAAKLG